MSWAADSGRDEALNRDGWHRSQRFRWETDESSRRRTAVDDASTRDGRNGKINTTAVH